MKKTAAIFIIAFFVLFVIILLINFQEKDDSKIIFQSVRDASPDDPDVMENTHKYFELYAMNADGSDVKRLTHNSYWENQAAFSPDGAKIIFGIHYDAGRLREADPGWEIAVMDANGDNLQRLTIKWG